MKWASMLVICAAILTWTAGASADTAVPTDAGTFVLDFIKDSVRIRDDASLTTAQRNALSRALLDHSYDVGSASRAILGHYWEKATPEQQNRYLTVFEDYLLASYGSKFDDVAKHLRLAGAASEGPHVVVHTLDAERAEGPVAIDWIVDRAEGQNWRITDVRINGASSVELMRQDFSAVLRANQGDIEALLGALRRQTAMLRSQS